MVRPVMLALALTLLSLGGCQWLTPRHDAEVTAKGLEDSAETAAKFRSPGSSGKIYSFDPRAQSIERSLGFER